MLDTRHGTVILDEPDATIDGRPFAHYVCFATDASPRADRLVRHPGVVEVAGASSARRLAPRLRAVRRGLSGRQARSRVGLLAHRLAHRPPVRSPSGHLAGAAFTIHFDPTSPANGFLRVLPGSHHGGPAGIPLGFERVPGEIAVYQERGDVLFHHADLWHGAARGTADGDPAVRRHLRGSWHGGSRLEPDTAPTTS